MSLLGFRGCRQLTSQLQIIPGLDNHVAISLVVTHIQNQLETRRRMQVRPFLSRGLSHSSSTVHSTSSKSRAPEAMALPPNVHLLDPSGESQQHHGIQTILRDSNSSREDFIFFSNRLATILAEESLRFVPSRPMTVQTDAGYAYEGTELDTEVRGQMRTTECQMSAH